MSVCLKISLDDPYLVLPGEGLVVPTLTQEEMIRTLAITKSSSWLSSLSSSNSNLNASTQGSLSPSIPLTNSTTASLIPPNLTGGTTTEGHSNNRDKYTTPLTSTLTLRITKPTRVFSEAKIRLSGITHLALLGTFGKRSHTFQQHLDLSQPLPLEPPPLTTAADSGGGDTEENVPMHDPSTMATREAAPSDITLLRPGVIKVPFILHVPNLSPPSATTPEGGTFYRLTASVVLESPSSSKVVSKIKSKLNIGTCESGAVETFTVLQIYRAPRSRCLYVQASAVLAEERAIVAETMATGNSTGHSSIFQSNAQEEASQRQDLEQEEEAYDRELQKDANDLVPVTVSDHYPGYCESRVSIPFTQLLKKSEPPELHVRIAVLNPKTILLKSFQVTLWERADHRVQRRAEEQVFEAAVLAGIVDPFASRKRYVIGIRERAVNTQRADASTWQRLESSPPPPHHEHEQRDPCNGWEREDISVATYDKRFAFTVPDPHCPNLSQLKKQGAAAGWGNTNSSTYTHDPKLKRVQRYEEDKEIKDEAVRSSPYRDSTFHPLYTSIHRTNDDCLGGSKE